VPLGRVHKVKQGYAWALEKRCGKKKMGKLLWKHRGKGAGQNQKTEKNFQTKQTTQQKEKKKKPTKSKRKEKKTKIKKKIKKGKSVSQKINI